MATTPEDVFRSWENVAKAMKGRVKKAPTASKGKRPPKPENAVVKACLHYLQTLNCFVWRNNTGGFKPYSNSGQVVRFGKVGSGDIIGMTPSGRFITIEAKSDKGTQSDYQGEFQRRVEACGGIYILARSTDDIARRRGEITP